MITLRNFLDGRSLFNEIFLINPLPFTDYSASDLDAMLNVLYGDKLVHIPIISCDLKVIAKMIIIKHSEEWDKILKIKALEEDIKTVKEISETLENSEVRLLDRTDTNKVSGYNSLTMVDSDALVGSSTDDLAGMQTKTVIDTHKDGERVYNLLSNSSKQSMINTVLENVNNFLTLSIY